MSKFKVRCAKAKDGRFIKGKIYSVEENGQILDEYKDGGCHNDTSSFKAWHESCHWTDYAFEPVTEPDRYELHITCFDGKTTNAVYKVNGEIKERKQAKCSPNDTFDFAIGAQEAFDRVFPKAEPTQPAQPEKVESKYKSGDRVKIIANYEWHRFPIGTIVRLIESGHYPKWKATALDGVAYSGSPYWFVSEAEIEPFTEPTTPEPTLYVTRKMLEKLGACSSGRAEFDSKFPSGKGEFEAVCKAAMPANESWLVNHKSQIAAMQDEKDEPIRLYCVKDYISGKWLTKGKIYELGVYGVTYDSGWKNTSSVKPWNERELGNYPLSHYLIPLVRRSAKVGDYILIMEEGCHGPDLVVGDIRRVIRTESDGTIATDKENVFFGKELDEFLILDGYQPEEKVEEYWSGKVVCVETSYTTNPEPFTVGKIYEYKNGIVLSNNGIQNDGAPAKSLKSALNSKYVKFIPYLGEAK